MLKKVSDSRIDNNNLHHLHFGLGKCYEDIKDYKNAFFHFNKANSIKKKSHIIIFKKISKNLKI